MLMIDLKFLKSKQLVNVEATIHICATCNLFLRSLQVSQQQTPSLVGLADNIDSKTIFTHNLDIIDSELIFYPQSRLPCFMLHATLQKSSTINSPQEQHEPEIGLNSSSPLNRLHLCGFLLLC